MPTALITGVTGQDGSYLAELLLEKGYEVHGLVRRASTINRGRIDHLQAYESGPNQRLFLHYGDLADSVSLVKLLYALQPDEIYNLAAQSHVRVSFDSPEYTSDITGVGAARILEAIIESGIGKKVRFYQASSSEMFGKVQAVPQIETTPFYPRSPYGCAKLFAQCHGTRLINMGRGGHLVETDLLEAMAAGQIDSATLDVTAVEPLPPGHAFWNHPRILLTPHVAGLSSPTTAAQVVASNIRRALAGQPLLHQVSAARGY